MPRLSALSLRSIPLPWKILALFSSIGLLALAQHAFWRDEVNPWLIARDSANLLELWQNVRYEGHPILWYLCLAALQRVTDSLLSMQLFHFSLGLASVALVCWYSPFRPREKLLFAFGYFPFYEYLLFSRNYVFGLLGSLLCCTLLPRRTSSYLPLALTLGLMANSHAYALVIAAFFGLILGLEFLCDRHQRQRYRQQSHPLDLALSLALFLSLLLLGAYTILPPADSQLHGGSSFLLSLDIRQIFVALGKIPGAYFLVIPNRKHWLDLILLDSIGLAFVVTLALALLRKPYALCFYLLASFATLFIFFYAKDLSGARHMGGLFIILSVSLWMADAYPEVDRVRAVLRVPIAVIQRAQHWAPRLWVFILCIQLGGGIVLMGYQFMVPWSASRATANAMKSAGLDRAFIVASRDAYMAPLAGYLDRQFYYPETQDMGSFTLFSARDRQGGLSAEVILTQTQEILQNQRPLPTPAPCRILLLLSRPLPDPFLAADPPLAASTPFPALQISPIAQFERSNVNSDEKYFLYWAKLNQAPDCPE